LSEGPEWFAPRRYGFGTGMPISWQGWALLIGFSAAAVAAVLAFVGHPIQQIAAAIPLIVVYFVISARTTRGGWRWHWGEDE
jgi:hypothetical protein